MKRATYDDHGGPPAPLALAVIIVRDVLWTLTGVVTLTATASVRRPTGVSTETFRTGPCSFAGRTSA